MDDFHVRWLVGVRLEVERVQVVDVVKGKNARECKKKVEA